jgi:DNA-binding transcriptional regulator YiaG
MSDREEFLTAKQLAEILQVSESTVRRWRKNVAFLPCA